MHQLGDTLTFTGVPLACFVLARRFAAQPGWRAWAMYSVATAFVFWALLIGFVVTSAHPTVPSGLFEKLAAGITSIWLLLLSIRLLKGGATAPRARPES